MKKMISVFLSAVMMLSLCPTAFASNSTAEKNSDNDYVFEPTPDLTHEEKEKSAISKLPETDTIQLRSVGHGEFMINDAISTQTENIANTASDAVAGEVIFAEPTADVEILKTSEGKYLVQVTEDSYLLTDKVNVELDDVNASRQILEEYNVPEKNIQEMEEIITYQKSIGNDEFAVDLYLPSEISAVSTGDVSTLGMTTKTTYYTYEDAKGTEWKMRDVNTKYTNVPTGMIEEKGVTAKEKAQAFVNVVLSAVGTKNVPVSLFGVGKSLYDLYVLNQGPVAQSKSGDYTSACAIYDRIEKVSQNYIQATGKYVSAKTSHKVWINRVDTYQFYSSTGKSDSSQVSVNKEKYSQYWDNGEKTLAKIGWEDYVTIKLYNTTVVLSGTSS